MPAKNKIMILGCGGMLGEAFYNTFKDDYDIQASDIDVNESWLTELDVRNYDAIRQDALKFKPEFIINLAAYTDLEFCENNPDETFLTNTNGAENGARISEEMGSTYVFISTAGIFDGNKDIYDDHDIPSPLSVYGKSKHRAELSIKDICTKYFIFRAGWMMGGGQKDKKFVHKIIKQLLAGKKELHVLNDLKGSPTYTYDFAENTKEMIATKFYGLYNMTCEGGPSRYEVAAEMLKIFDLQDRIELIEVKSDHFSQEYFAPRPESEVLDNLKLKTINLDKMRAWDLSLKEYLEKDWAQIVKEKVS